MTEPLTPPDCDLRQPPYQADTLARGWRFEVDMETFKRSDTWKRARTGAMRGALLLLWAESWQEKPCGTLPDDGELIALLIDMPAATFEKNRSVLLRGWWKANDGRLYHETITTRVLAMLDKRANDAQRAANRRARNADSTESPPGVAAESRVTLAGVHPEFDTKHQAPSTISEPEVQKVARKRAQTPETVSPAVLIEAGFDAATAAEFIACKASRKAPLTARAWADHLREAAKAGWSPLAAAEKVMGKTWKGFEAKYVADEPRPVVPAQTFRERDAEAATAEVQRWAPTIAKRAEPITLEMESPHGTAVAIR